MSLTGNLEDLPLLDILQIVSFSKKTGHLTIRAASGEGAIVFRDGLLVSAFTWDSAPLDPRARALPADKRDQYLRTRIELALEQLIRLREGQFSFSLSDEPPVREHEHLIARLGFGQIVRGEHDGYATRSALRLDQSPHAIAMLRIEAGRRLVQQQQIGLVDDRARNIGETSKATRELTRRT